MWTKPKKKRTVYFDHSATTYVDKNVFKAMVPFFVEKYGNPSSLYQKGRENAQVLSEKRKEVAQLLHALPENIIFTSGGTESDNLAIYGVARSHEHAGKHIISTPIEHHAVLHPLEDLKKHGWEITYIKVNEFGLVDPGEVLRAIRPDTVLISIMYANNEIGTIQPLAEIGKEILKYRQARGTAYPFFHTDACQAGGYLDLDVEKLHVDLMTLNGSKVYGPKGNGLLYIRRGIRIKPLFLGGGQEKNLRSGTENVPGIVGLVEALKMAQKNRAKESARLEKLSKYFWKSLQQKIPKIQLNGPEYGPNRLPNNLNVTFMDVEGEAMLLYLDEYGIMCSTGSACTSESLEPSYVLRALGLPYEYAHGSLRFTLGHFNTKADIDYTMKYLPMIVEKLRELSPVNLGKVKHAKYK